MLPPSSDMHKLHSYAACMSAKALCRKTCLDMQGDEAFKCEACNEKTEATKRLRLYRLPQVLLLHIKRFKYSGTSREKLTNNVTFPIKVCKCLKWICLVLSCMPLQWCCFWPQ